MLVIVRTSQRLAPQIATGGCRVTLISNRAYATQTGLGTTTPTPPPRRKVTVLSDDGRVPWGQLSPAEKVARTTQQSFNFSFVAVGAVATVGVAYFLWTNVFSPDSYTAHFNEAVNRILIDARCTDVLGDSKKITAHGEETWNKWRRARPITSSVQRDGSGTDHLIMRFYVEGPKNRGTVNLHMTKRPPQGEFQYKYLSLDVKGQPRIYLENVDTAAYSLKGGVTKLFGVQWR